MIFSPPFFSSAISPGTGPELSYQSAELINRKVSLTKNGAECAPIEFLVIRNNRLDKWIVPTNDDMAAVLALNVKSIFPQSADGVAA